jgi:hypothetical protein
MAILELITIGNSQINHKKWDISVISGIVEQHDLVSGLPSLPFSTVFLQERFSVLH